MTDLNTAMQVAASGMKAQSTRLRVVAGNMANANSTGGAPGADPYRRQVVTFQNVLDDQSGVDKVAIKQIMPDRSDFGLRFDPNHPAANEDGYVKTPNVNSLVEVMDMREAQRSYEANLEMLDAARTMTSRTLELLR